MRLCAALAVVLVALVVVTVKANQRHPRRAAASIEPVLAEPLPETAPAPARSSPSLPRYESGGIAHLRGHLLFPAGEERSNDLVVVAEGTTRQFRAHAPDGVRYEIHLPSGRYTLVASMGNLVGVVPDVLARAGGPRDVDIRLTVGAVISGRVKAPPGAAVEVSAARTLDSRRKSDVQDGTFAIAGLIPGRQYDITFDGADVRRLKVTGVTAPDDALDVEVVPLAKVAGAIGFPRGGRCPITNAGLRLDGAPDGYDPPSKFVGPDCRFSLVAPDNVASVTVVATGDGWNLEQSVAIPPASDPEPICLNPPCRSDPLEGLAKLHISFDAPESSTYSSVFLKEVGRAWGGEIYRTCEGSCDVEGLPPGTTYAISGNGSRHQCDETQMTVVAGDNQIRLPCHQQRHIEGVVRGGEGKPPEGLAVRCVGSGSRRVVDTHFFHIDCNADAASLEYQIGQSGNWFGVPIATVGDPALVEIDL